MCLAHYSDFHGSPVLDYLAVHPENKSEGIGTALLNHGIQYIEKLGIDIFALGCPAGFRVYHNAGFKVLDSIVQDATKFGGNDNCAFQFMEYEVKKG